MFIMSHCPSACTRSVVGIRFIDLADMINTIVGGINNGSARTRSQVIAILGEGRIRTYCISEKHPPIVMTRPYIVPNCATGNKEKTVMQYVVKRNPLMNKTRTKLA